MSGLPSLPCQLRQALHHWLLRDRQHFCYPKIHKLLRGHLTRCIWIPPDHRRRHNAWQSFWYRLEQRRDHLESRSRYGMGGWIWRDNYACEIIHDKNCQRWRRPRSGAHWTTAGKECMYWFRLSHSEKRADRTL